MIVQECLASVLLCRTDFSQQLLGIAGSRRIGLPYADWLRRTCSRKRQTHLCPHISREKFGRTQRLLIGRNFLLMIQGLGKKIRER